MTFRLAVVSAGLSQPSSARLLADRLAAAASGALRSVGHEVQITTIELRPLAHAITDAMLCGFPAGDLSDALASLAAADAVIAVTPVFSGSFSGLFKSFIDVLPRGDLAGTPVLIAATGGSARHSLVLDHALRPLLTFHQATTVPTGVFAATGDFGTSESDGLSRRVERATRELAGLVGPASRGLAATAQVADPPLAATIVRTRQDDTDTAFTPLAEILAARAG